MVQVPGSKFRVQGSKLNAQSLKFSGTPKSVE